MNFLGSRRSFAAVVILAAAMVASQAASQLSSQPQDRSPSLGTAEATERLGQPAGPVRSGPELAHVLDAVASELRCPVCQGLSVAASPSESARAMRQEIEGLLAKGYSREQVIDYFEGSYGEFVRLLPRPRGFNLLVFVLPILLLAAGAAIVFRRARSSKVAASAAADPELERYREQVRASLRQ